MPDEQEAKRTQLQPRSRSGGFRTLLPTAREVLLARVLLALSRGESPTDEDLIHLEVTAQGRK